MINNPLSHYKRLFWRVGFAQATLRALKHGFGLIHKHIRRYMPVVEVKETLIKHRARLGDTLSGDYDPNGGSAFEKEGVKWIVRHTRSEDNVCIIGGGFGVTARAASRASRLVWVFEPSRHQLETYVQIQGDNIIGVHGSVGDDSNTYGDKDKTGVSLSAQDVPRCDVLEVDCEGGEQRILEGLEQRPRVVIVETHPQYGCSNKRVVSLLRQRGYDVTVETDQIEDGHRMLNVLAKKESTRGDEV